MEQLQQELEKQRQLYRELESSKEAESRALAEQKQRNKELESRLLADQKRIEQAESHALAAQKRIEQAESHALAAQKRIEQAESRALADQKLRKEAEKAVEPTDFQTFLSLCHHNLHSNMVIQEDPALSATGLLTHVDNKHYPLYLKPWANFPSLLNQCHARLESLFNGKNAFPSVNGFKSMNDILSMDEPLADENDVRLLHFINVESCARRILFQYMAEVRGKAAPAGDGSNQDVANDDSDGSTRTTLPLRLYFSNAPHGILVDTADGTEDSDSQHSSTEPAYKPAMLKAQQADAESRGRLEGDEPPPAKRKLSPTRKLHPDQWFMRVNGDGSVVPVFVVEYKAAHKLRASALKLALSEAMHEPRGLFFTAIGQQMQNKTSQDEDVKLQVRAEQATARVICQAFHYMVEFGLCYSYVASGEALLLLYFDEADVRTLYYHLAVPGEDVELDAEKSMQLSAVSLVSTLALLALDGPILSQRWKRLAVDALKQWPAAYDEMEIVHESSGEEDGKKLKDAPHLPQPKTQQGCTGDPQRQRRRRKDGDDEDDKDFTRRQPQSGIVATKQYATRSKSTKGSTGTSSNTNSAGHQRKPLPYCSQSCLRGLRDDGLLDHDCPNVHLHLKWAAGKSKAYHGLTATQFCHRLQEQLADDLDENCDALDKYGKFGAIGMMFRLTLQDYGYCVAAKGVQRAHVLRLKREIAMYDHLHEQQGTLVPVCLGMIDLVEVYRTSVGAHIAHMMVLSYSGEPLYARASRPLPDNIESLIYDVWHELRRLGVEHGDESEPNLLWDAATRRLMCIDFEWAKMIEVKKKRKRRANTPPSPDASRRHRLGVQKEAREDVHAA